MDVGWNYDDMVMVPIIFCLVIWFLQPFTFTLPTVTSSLSHLSVLAPSLNALLLSPFPPSSNLLLQIICIINVGEITRGRHRTADVWLYCSAAHVAWMFTSLLQGQGNDSWFTSHTLARNLQSIIIYYCGIASKQQSAQRPFMGVVTTYRPLFDKKSASDPYASRS